jgi:hypothetical protein
MKCPICKDDLKLCCDGKCPCKLYWCHTCYEPMGDENGVWY